MRFYKPPEPGNRPAPSGAGFPAWMAEYREKIKSKYFKLECGHYTFIQEQIAFMVWRPENGKYLCTDCKEWKKKMPKIYYTLPDIPEF